ncbi:MAG: amidohydrolase family protein [Candidatus Thorarchaeota archaeon]
MIIDGHAHASGDFRDPEKLISILDSLGVDKIVLCPGPLEIDGIFNIPKISYTPISKIGRLIFLGNKYFLKHDVDDDFYDRGNEVVSSMTKKFPDRILHFYWVDPLDKNVIDKLENAMKSGKIHGIKLHQCLSDFSNDSEEMNKLAEFAGKYKLPIFIHIFSVLEVKKLLKLARRYPKTNFIFGHSIGLEIAKRKGKDLDNLYFDISTYYIIAKRRIRFAIKHFGANHVLLGSDSPFGEKNLENNIKKIQGMKLSKEVKDLILGKNMMKLLNLS